MPASVFAAIASFSKVVRGKDQSTHIVKVVIFGFAGKRGFLFSILWHLLGLK